MSQPEMNRQDLSTHFSGLQSLTALVGVIAANAMTLSLLLAVALNVRALYQVESNGLEVVLASFWKPIEAGVLFAAWIPIVICIACFAIVIGGVAIIIWTNWVQQALAAINRLSRTCSTLPWWKKGWCFSMLFSLIGALTAALGIFFTAAAVVMINVIVILFAL